MDAEERSNQAPTPGKNERDTKRSTKSPNARPPEVTSVLSPLHLPLVPEGAYGNETVSPFEAPHRYNHPDFYLHGKASSTLRRVSKRAALASKKVIWDSNDNAIDAAQIAVDQWEDVYNALRALLVVMTHSAMKLYRAAKAGATGLEHGILVPVRDWVLLPAFDAAENTIGFLQSEQAKKAASQSLQLAHQVPWIGPTVLAPSMVLSVQILQTAWQIAQYPIPSRHQVRNSVDFVLTGTKYALVTAVREIMLYMKRADAIITRTLSHTQWKVLGSGPYATLDKLNKQEVIDHLCERYFNLRGTIARYELAAHIRTHNLPLYLDLVLTGLLRERGGELTKDDEWLSSCPSYRKHTKESFLLPNFDYEGDDADSLESVLSEKESALWFRLPYVNGKRPGRDAPWIRFNGIDRAKLEQRYLEVYREGKRSDLNGMQNGWNRPATTIDQGPPESSNKSEDGEDGDEENMNVTSGYPTIAQWYVPDLKRDVLVDQKRHSVSYHRCCPRCREPILPKHQRPTGQQQSTYSRVCQHCTESQAADRQAVVTNHWMASSILSPPPLCMVMRPNLWRFHGPGDEVRRAIWFLDTRRHGLQPYGEEAQAVLEDAYHFLKWRNEYLKEGLNDAKKEPPREPILESHCPETMNDSGGAMTEDEETMVENSLLTVQVESPDGGELQLVQFSSLTAVTAIKKGLGGAISLFKRRVYRGADLSHPKLPPTFGVSPEAVFSGDVNLQTHAHSHPREPEVVNEDDAGDYSDTEGDDADWTVMPKITEESLAVPATQFDDIDRDPKTRNAAADDDEEEEDNIDHLVLIVHGIGEMLQSVDLFGLAIPNLASIIDCAGYMRKNHDEVQSARFSHIYPTAEAVSTAATGRVEYIPVEWHEAFSIASQRMSPTAHLRKRASSNSAEGQLVQANKRSSKVMMQDISLRTIPQLRDFANNTLFDVLFFMSAEHHDVMIDIVTKEMNAVVQKFRALTGFCGKVSIIGHSLGSIITWDILANQTPSGFTDNATDESSNSLHDQGDEWEDVSSSSDGTSGVATRLDDVVEATAYTVEANSEQLPKNALTRRKKSAFRYPKLNFDVDNAFMLGSPIAVFLMIRNQNKPLSPDYSLKGCSRVFNIFHPYDPVAYRIEPLMDGRNAEFEPRIMMHWNGGFRVQYQTKRLWRKLIQTTMETQQTVIERLEAGIAGIGFLDSTADLPEDDNQSQRSSAKDDEGSANSIVTGNLNQGRRIDYMLQEKEIEAANEYVAALAAHSCYWQEKDLSLFIARQLYLSRLAAEQALHFEDLLDHDGEM